MSYYCNRDCHYCYAKGMSEEYIGNLSLEDYTALLDWLGENGINHFDFIGGEPSLHPRIGEFVRLAKKRKFRFGMFTNALFPKKTFKDLKDLDFFVVNYNHRGSYRKDEWEKLNRNIKLLSSSKASIDVACNVSSEIVSIDHILDLKNKKKIKINRVQMHLISPNALKNNDYIQEKQLIKEKKKMISFIDKLEKNGIKVKVTRPIPKCIFTEKELKKLGDKVYFSCSTGQSIVLVNPDLTVFPCTSVFFKGPKITKFLDISDYQNYYKDVLDKCRRDNPRYAKCLTCKDFIVKCQGGCINDGLKPFKVFSEDKYVINSQVPLGDFENGVKKSIKKLEKYFGKLSQKIVIYLLSNREEFDHYLGKNNWPDWVKGISMGKKGKRLNYFHIGNSTNRLDHELAHLFIDDKNVNNPPFWVKEGICEYMYSSNDDKKLKQLLTKNSLFDFKKMNSVYCSDILKINNTRPDNNIAYKQVQSFLSFLTVTFGWETVLKFLIEPSDDFYKHFKELTNNDFSQVEKKWRKHLAI